MSAVINSEPDRTNRTTTSHLFSREEPRGRCPLLRLAQRAPARSSTGGRCTAQSARHKKKADKSSRGTKRSQLELSDRHISTCAQRPQSRSAAELRASMMLHNSERRRRGGEGGVRRRSQLMRRKGGQKPRDGTARGDSKTILHVFKPPFAGHLTSCIFHAFGERHRRDQSGHCDRDDITNESWGKKREALCASACSR